MSHELPSLMDLWTEYKAIELTGKRSKRAISLEEIIHQKQKSIGSSAYDFDKRWEKNKQMGESTVSGPPLSKPEEPKSPQVHFSVEQAKKLIGENDCALLDDCAKWAEARMVYLAYVLDKINPDNSNVARRGQATNIAIGEFNRRKDE